MLANRFENFEDLFDGRSYVNHGYTEIYYYFINRVGHPEDAISAFKPWPTTEQEMSDAFEDIGVYLVERRMGTAEGDLQTLLERDRHVRRLLQHIQKETDNDGLREVAKAWRDFMHTELNK